MADNDVKYELKTVQTVRGTESRSIAKWQEQGWELVNQETGRVRTALRFRRPKPQLPWKLIGAAAAFLVVLIAAGGIASALSGGEDGDVKADKPSATVSASESPPESPTPSADPTVEQVLTPANSKELAALMRMDYCDGANQQFAKEHASQQLEFNGSVVNVAETDDGYDITLGNGNQGPNTTDGPVFKYEGVTHFDLNFTDGNEPAELRAGDLLHITASVGRYDADQCLFYLDPVATKLR